MAVYPKRGGEWKNPFAFDCIWKLPSFCQTARERSLFFAVCWACEERSVPPSTSRAAAHPPASAYALCTRSVGTRRCPSQCSVIIGAHTGTAWASHGLPCSQVRERATTENGLARPSRAPGAPAPHAPPTFAARPTLLMPLRRTLRTHVFWFRRAGRTVRSRCRRATRWMWISR